MRKIFQEKNMGGQNTQTQFSKKSGSNMYENTSGQNSKKLGGKIPKTGARFTDTISNLQKTGAHFTKFVKILSITKNLRVESAKFLSQICINSENLICKITSSEIKVRDRKNLQIRWGGKSVQKSIVKSSFLFATKVLFSFPLRVLFWFLLRILVWFLLTILVWFLPRLFGSF